jgi:hypothetical protein
MKELEVCSSKLHDYIYYNMMMYLRVVLVTLGTTYGYFIVIQYSSEMVVSKYLFQLL